MASTDFEAVKDEDFVLGDTDARGYGYVIRGDVLELEDRVRARAERRLDSHSIPVRAVLSAPPKYA
ncbi:MAG: hypothetical protein AAF569_01880 [Pseudomonadota bacterium]